MPGSPAGRRQLLGTGGRPDDEILELPKSSAFAGGLVAAPGVVKKRWIQWGIGLAGLLLLVVVALLLGRDALLRLTVEHALGQTAGLQAHLGHFHLGLTEPVIEIKQLELNNPPAFGNTPFLKIPEIYVRYDRAALARNELHFTRLRLDLDALEIVKSPDGQTNLSALGIALTAPAAAGARGASHPELAEFKRQTGLDFRGIDLLQVSVGEFRYVDQQHPENNRTQTIGIRNFVVSNVVSAADLAGLGLLVGLRSGDFFKPLVLPGDAGAGPSATDLLKLLNR